MIQDILILVKGTIKDEDGRYRDLEQDPRYSRNIDGQMMRVFITLESFFDFLIDIGEFDEIATSKKHQLTKRVIDRLKG